MKKTGLNINSKKYLKKIYVITFPHDGHLKGNYKVNVSKIINELDLHSKIIHIDFNKLIKNNQFQRDNIYEAGDPASHLNVSAHSLYIEKIFDIININTNK